MVSARLPARMDWQNGSFRCSEFAPSTPTTKVGLKLNFPLTSSIIAFILSASKDHTERSSELVAGKFPVMSILR
jgi:hypothetical protein